MDKFEMIQRLVSGLSAEELSRFRHWFETFDGYLWDRQIEADSASGKLDRLLSESMAEHLAGNSKPL